MALNHMNELHVEHLTVRLNDGPGASGDAPGEAGVQTLAITEFMVDGQPLSDLLGVARDLGNCGCDLDPSLQRGLPAVTQRGLQALLALAPPFNQLGSDRTVLYRCHCGCDACGVISARIQAVAETDAPRDAAGLPIAAIEWLDVGFEDGASAPPDVGPCARRLPRLVFERQGYEQALNACLMKPD